MGDHHLPGGVGIRPQAVLDISPNDVGRILIVKPSALGDIVHSLPFLNAMRKRFPHAEIHWVVATGLQEILEGHPQVDRIWIINKNQWKKLSRARETAGELAALFRELKRAGFDLAVDLQGLLRSGLITMATRASYRIGFREAREGSPLFYTHKVAGGRNIHAIDRYLKIAAFLGCDAGDVSYVFPPLPGLDWLGEPLPGEYAVIAPSAGKKANRWPAQRFGELASMLPIASVVISSGADKPLADEVVAASRGRAVSLAGRTSLKQMASVIKGARLFISNDTGPMHIAAAFGVPVFAIFGPANPVRTGPYGDIHAVIREDLDCSPCYRKTPCENWICLERITAARVHGVIMEKLSTAA